MPKRKLQQTEFATMTRATPGAVAEAASNPEASAAAADGEDDGIYFWRETEPETGYLSQWWPCDFTDEKGVVYKTAEQ
jgi:hypothetical protein